MIKVKISCTEGETKFKKIKKTCDIHYKTFVKHGNTCTEQNGNYAETIHFCGT